MNDQFNATPKKRGPKPIGDAPMTAAERQRRRREQMRAGGSKSFLLEIDGLHLQHIEELAQSQGITTAAALRQIVSASLDRYVGVMRRAERMVESGASDEEQAKFMLDNLFPELRPIDEYGPSGGDAK